VATHGSFRTALLSAGTVVLVVVAIVTGLAAVGIVRSAVGGSDALSPLSQEAVGDHLRTAAAPSVVGPTAHPPTVGPTAPARGTASPSPSAGPARTTSPSGGPRPSSTAPGSARPSGVHSTRPSSTPPPPQPTPSPAPTSQTRLIYSVGGSAVAVCTGPLVRLQSFSPAQGYQVAEAEEGPAPQVQVVFRATSGTRQVEVQISCRAGVPVAEVDDSASGGGSDDGYGGGTSGGSGYDG
jgi:hypothetical protein